jgi:hypothetical protein
VVGVGGRVGAAGVGKGAGADRRRLSAAAVGVCGHDEGDRHEQRGGAATVATTEKRGADANETAVSGPRVKIPYVRRLSDKLLFSRAIRGRRT